MRPSLYSFLVSGTQTIRSVSQQQPSFMQSNADEANHILRARCGHSHCPLVSFEQSGVSKAVQPLDDKRFLPPLQNVLGSS